MRMVELPPNSPDINITEDVKRMTSELVYNEYNITI